MKTKNEVHKRDYRFRKKYECEVTENPTNPDEASNANHTVIKPKLYGIR